MGRACAVAAVAACWALGQSACDAQQSPSGAEPEGTAVASASASAVGLAGGDLVLPPERKMDTNPLRLPAKKLPLAEGTTVYAPTKRVLSSLRQGLTLVMQAVTVDGLDGDDIVVHPYREQPYAVHPGYVIVPDMQGQLQRGSNVLIAYRGELKHGVVVTPRLDQATVQYTDLGYKVPELKLPRSSLGLLREGLQPGGFAVHRHEHEWHHVMLISSGVHSDGVKRWLTVGYAGETQLIEERALQALSLSFTPKSGATVWVAWRGRMVPATVQAHERPGLFFVKRPRTGGAMAVGWGLLMPPATRE